MVLHGAHVGPHLGRFIQTDPIRSDTVTGSTGTAMSVVTRSIRYCQRIAKPEKVLSEQRGSAGGTMIPSGNEPQIKSQAAVPVSAIQLLTPSSSAWWF